MFKTLALIGLVIFALTSAGAVLADDATTNTDHMAHHDTTKKMKEMTPEMRQKMADAHQKMADCLKSTKPISECKEQMMKDCPMMKNGHCTMMEGMGGPMDGKKMDGMMSDKSKKKSDDSSSDHSAYHPDNQ